MIIAGTLQGVSRAQQYGEAHLDHMQHLAQRRHVDAKEEARGLVPAGGALLGGEVCLVDIAALKEAAPSGISVLRRKVVLESLLG